MELVTTKPKGCDNPEVYTIAGFPHEEDFIAGYPLAGAAGQYYLRVLSAYDASDKVRIINMCPTEEGIPSWDYIISDLNSLKSRPKVIVTLSSEVTQFILGDQFTTIRAMQGNVFTKWIDGHKYLVVPAYSPGWILEELRLASDEDKYTTAPTEFAKSMHKVSAIIRDEYVDIISTKKMKYCMTFNEFLNTYLQDHYYKEEQLAYDVETTAHPIFNEDLEIIGFSIAKKNEGFYVCIESLDYSMTSDDRFKTFSLLKDILVDHKVVVHNSMYERPLTLKSVGYDIPYETCDDTLAMARLMLGGHVGAGLKVQAQTHCGYPDWETNMHAYLDSACIILRTIYHHFQDKERFPDIKSMISLECGNKWKEGFDWAINEFRNACYKHYNLEETENLLQLLANKVDIYFNKNQEPPKVLPYSFIPWRILCQYGALDSIATIDIRDHYLKWMKKESSETCDLMKGYQVILKQMYAGYILERNGMYWDEEVATGRQAKWEEMCVENLKSMIRSPYLKESMIENNLGMYVPKLLGLHFPEVALSQGFRVDYDIHTDKYGVFDLNHIQKNGKPKKVAMGRIWDIQLNDQIKEAVYEMLLEDVDRYNTRGDLSRLYNPSSSKESDIALEILYTPEAKIAIYLDKLAIYARSVRYNPKVKSLFDKDKDRDVLNACHMISTCLDQIADIKNNRDIKWSIKRQKIADFEAVIEDHKPLALSHPRIRNFVYNKERNVMDDIKEDEEFNIDKAVSAKLSYSSMTEIQCISDTMLCSDLDDEYLRLAFEIWDDRSLRKKYPDSWWIERGKLFDQFKTLFEVAKPHSSKLLSMISDSEISSMAEDNIIKMYVVYQYLGVDPDNPSTWSERYKWLIDYRIYKKLLKLITAYLEGKVGRGSVYMVNKESLSSGENCVIRGRGYDKYTGAEDDYVLASNFGVATADTLRWRSGMHVIPWGSPIKKFYSSRFKGGTMLAPDYSQCFTGDTRIKCLDGNSYSFKSLVDRGVEDLWVYSCKDDGSVVPALATFPRVTKKVSRLCHVTLDTGEVIRCTPDHRFMLRDGTYKEAQYLTIEDSLMPGYIKTNDNGYIQIWDNNLEKYVNVHTLVNMIFHQDQRDSLVIPPHYFGKYRIKITHHKDFNKTNNLPDNLEWMSWGDHKDLHNSHWDATLGEWVKSDRNRELARQNLIKFNKSDKHRDQAIEMGRTYGKINGPKYGAENLRKAAQTDESRARHKQNLIDYTQTEEHAIKSSIRITDNNYNPEYRVLIMKGKIKNIINELLSCGMEFNKESYDFLNKKRKGPRYDNILLYFPSYEDAFEYSIHYNHKVASIEIVDYEEEIPVYDLTVEGYNNFLLDSGVFVHNCEVRTLAASSKCQPMLDAFAQGLDFHRNTAALAFRKSHAEVTDAERRFCKMASFSILYGALVQSFADNYCGGDLDQAKVIYEGFYTAYPEVKKWIEDRHDEYKRTGRVSTLANFYIVIAPEGVDNYVGSISSALRKAQNYPIQGASSAAVGCVVFAVSNYIAHENLLSKVVLFVHDSIEIDVYPYELIKIVSKLRSLLVDVPMEEFGLPAEADFSLGRSIGHEHQLKLWEPNEDQTSVHMIMEGFEDELEETFAKWREVYDLDIHKIYHVEKDSDGNKVEVEGFKSKYIPYDELFVLKRAYNEYVGLTRREGRVDLTLTYKTPRIDCTRRM